MTAGAVAELTFRKLKQITIKESSGVGKTSRGFLATSRLSCFTLCKFVRLTSSLCVSDSFSLQKLHESWNTDDWTTTLVLVSARCPPPVPSHAAPHLSDTRHAAGNGTYRRVIEKNRRCVNVLARLFKFIQHSFKSFHTDLTVIGLSSINASTPISLPLYTAVYTKYPVTKCEISSV